MTSFLAKKATQMVNLSFISKEHQVSGFFLSKNYKTLNYSAGIVILPHRFVIS